MDGSIILRRLAALMRSCVIQAAPARDFDGGVSADQALQNLLIDKSVNKVPVNDWHKAHAYKSPDLTPAKRKDARQQLQDKGLIVINDSMVWINREVEANMEPYLDSEG
jgi:hypothetical protein